jgi:hypothetical protein
MLALGKHTMQETSVRRPARSFILRLWPGDDPEASMRGEIELIATGEKRFFQDPWALLHLLETWAHDTRPAQ